MKLNYKYSGYFVLVLISSFLYMFNMTYLSTGFKWVTYFILFLTYYRRKNSNDFLFYFILFFAGIGESLILLGVKDYVLGINYVSIIYTWLLIFLLRKNDSKRKLKIISQLTAPLLISALAVIYVVFEVFILVTEKIQHELFSTYLLLFSYIVLFFYLGLLYVSTHSQKYIWLQMFMVTLISSLVLGSLVFWQNERGILSGLFIFIQMTCHFSLLNFFIRKDDKIAYVY